MTKQHFTLIAQAVAEAARYLRDEASCERLTADQIVRTVADFLARRLAETNPLFSRRRFYDACGLN
jgi:glycerol-3-phosphate dehydrogenase